MQRKRHRRKKIALRSIGLFFLTILLLLLLILQSSSFQTYAARKVGDYLAEKTNSKISIGKVEFQWFKKLALKDFLVLDHQNDTLLFAHDLFMKVDDYDLSEQQFFLESLALEDASFQLIKHKGDSIYNLNQFLRRLDLSKQKKDSTKLVIDLKHLVLKDARLKVWDENRSLKEFGMDYRHLSLSQLDGELDSIHFEKDTVKAKIQALNFVDRCGFELDRLRGNALICPTEQTIDKMELVTARSHLSGRLSFSTKQYADLKLFSKKVKIQSALERSHLYGRDLSYFVPVLKGLEEEVKFQGSIKGKVARLKLRDFELEFGKRSYLKGRANIDGLPKADNTFLLVKIKELKTNSEDVSNLPLPPFNEEKHIKTPTWFSNLGDVEFKGDFTGFPSDFVAYGKFRTACGTVESDVNFREDNLSASAGNHTAKVLEISGGVKTNAFDLGQLLNKPALGQMAYKGKLDATVKDNGFYLVTKGKLPLLEVKDYSYRNIKVDGKLTPDAFNGELSINDTNLVLAFNGGVDFSKRQQAYKFKAKVERANVHQLNLVNSDTSAKVSFAMDIDLRGNRIDDIFGSVKIDDFNWQDRGKDFHFDRTVLRSMKTKERDMIDLKSDWVTARIEGKYDLRELYSSLLNIMARDLPSLTDWKYSKAKSKGRNDFRMMFSVKDYTFFNRLFTPDLNFKKARFSGSFNDKEQVFHMNFKADTIRYKKQFVKGVELYGHNRSEKVNLKLSSDFIAFSKKTGLRSFGADFTSDNNLTDFEVHWNNDKEKLNNAHFKGMFGMERLDSLWTHLNQFDLVIEDNHWEMDSLNRLVISPKGVQFDHFEIHSQGELIDVEGVLSAKGENNLLVRTDNFQLENLDRLFEKFKLGIKGSASGDLHIEGFSNSPVISSDMQIDGFHFNNKPFGRVCMRSDYHAPDSRVGLNLTIDSRSRLFKQKTLELSGDYYPKRDGAIDLSCKMKNLKVSFLERYFEGVFSDFKRGKTSGRLRITGTVKDPNIQGHVRLDQMNLTIDYLNVKYAVNGQYLYFDDDNILLKNFALRHNKYLKSNATVNGVVSHKAFKDFKYRLDAIRLNNFLALNTTIDDNSSYFGTAFVDGLLQVDGDVKSNNISGTISTLSYEDKLQKGHTELNLPLGEVGELEVSDFVHFVDLSSPEKDSTVSETNLDLSGLSLDFNFLIHPEATTRIIFDPKVGDEIQVNGEGNVNMKINSKGMFRMSGAYTIEKGDYYFTLKNFIGKRFVVEKGGTIAWDGDPLGANINIGTSYPARAKLIDLVNPEVVNYEDLSQQYSGRSQVNANLNLSGALMQPEITMGVSMPNGTAQEKEFLQSHLQGEDEINRQVFALLLTNQFLPTTSHNIADAVNIGTGIDNGIQFLEGQLNNALGGVLNNVDLGVDYNSAGAGDSLSNDELRLLLGFQYKNFSIQTDYALNNESGEIQVEYKLTDQLRAKAYRRRTEQVILDNGSNITQGAGLVFQTSFDSLAELFGRSAKKIVESDE